MATFNATAARNADTKLVNSASNSFAAVIEDLENDPSVDKRQLATLLERVTFVLRDRTAAQEFMSSGTAPAAPATMALGAGSPTTRTPVSATDRTKIEELEKEFTSIARIAGFEPTVDGSFDGLATAVNTAISARTVTVASPSTPDPKLFVEKAAVKKAATECIRALRTRDTDVKVGRHKVDGVIMKVGEFNAAHEAATEITKLVS